MITTVTLNVSVDKAYHIKGIVVPGTVARVQKCVNSAGGKGLNVSRIIDFCGEEVLATGFAGGFNGAYVEDMLKKDGIQSRFTKTQAETRSCINILAEDESSTEYLEPGAPVSEKEVEQFLKDFDQIIDESDVITMSGSVPAGVPKDIYATLVKMIKNKEKKVILDTSGDYLKEGIKAGPTMVKPNDEELEALLGIKIENRYQTIDAAKEMLAQYPYEFKLGIKYILEGKKITTRYIIENKDKEIMPFQIGGHPGFHCPLCKEESYEDYELVFEQKETCTVPTPVTETGLIDMEHRSEFLKDTDTLPLKHDLFAVDAVILDQLKSRAVTLKSKKHNKGIRLDFNEFPYLILWSTAKEADFVALEPWIGLSTCSDEGDKFEEKRNIQYAQAGEVKEYEFHINVL